MQTKPVRVPDFRAKKQRGEKIAMLTAYDATMARLFDRAGLDALLVGDSLGMVVLGHDSTIPVTLDDMVHHTRAVSRGTRRALVVTDLPFLTYQASVADAVRNAGALMRAGATAVKLEGGRPVLDAVSRLTEVGVPVMGHLGLQPQSVHQAGGYAKRATEPREADALLEDALALQAAGAFAIVLESIPAELARRVTATIQIPTIGIGAGPHCDGQVLVGHDMLGLFDEFVPSFVKQYAQLAETVVNAAHAYADDVRAGRYPQAIKAVQTTPV
jgi:3-methyl-2-oxobutanoate hydroxymethyltransferase